MAAEKTKKFFTANYIKTNKLYKNLAFNKALPNKTSVENLADKIFNNKKNF